MKSFRACGRELCEAFLTTVMMANFPPEGG